MANILMAGNCKLNRTVKFRTKPFDYKILIAMEVYPRFYDFQ